MRKRCRKSGRVRARLEGWGGDNTPSCFETAASPPPQHEGHHGPRHETNSASRGETRSRSRERKVVQSQGCGFFLFFVLFRPVIGGQVGRPEHRRPRAFPLFIPPLTGNEKRWVVARRLFFSCYLQGKTGGAGAAFAGCRRRRGSLPHAVSAGARLRDQFCMALLPLFRSRTREAELQHRVYALQAALDQCKGVARSWWSMRVRFTVAVALVAMAAGFALGVYRHTIKQAFVDSAVAVGLASPADGAAEAETAFQKADYAKALKLARPLAEDGDPRAEAVLGSAYYRGRGVPQNDSEAAKWFRLAADKGNAAARCYRRAAEQGDPQAQYNLGLAYARGEGVTQNAVEAHMWFNLAAARFPASDTRNRTAAVKNRDTVAGEMSSEQLAEAQKRAREWKPQS